jgi:S-formylglutathione hydrolase FrmB
MKKVQLIALLLSLYVTTLPARDQHILNTRHLPASDTVWVFTPAPYAAQPGKTFPVVYLLHGWSGTYRQWNDITDCQLLADRYGFIIVCPDGLYDSWYINSPALKQSRYADFFFFDLVPYITEKYRIDLENQFITGLSMGGHGALWLFAQQPDRFRSAGSLSGVLDLSFCPDEYRIGEYLVPKGKKPGKRVLAEYSVTGNIGKIAGSGKAIIFSCGASDRFYGLNKRFRQQCDEAGIPATYIVSPGDHNYAYWRSAIGFHFDFFAKQVVPKTTF